MQQHLLSGYPLNMLFIIVKFHFCDYYCLHSCSHGPMAKCPLCGSPLKENDLVRDKKLEKMVKSSKTQKDTHQRVVNL